MRFKVNLSLVCLISMLLLITSCDQEIGSDPFVGHDTTETLNKIRCVSENHMSELMQDPEYAALRAKRLLAFEKVEGVYLKQNGCANTYVLPVAVHFQNAGSTNRSCLTDLARQQINILNADFAGTNDDITKWTNGSSSTFPGVNNGETCVQFVLANKNHPSGFGLSDGDPALTINQTNGDQVNQWSGYLNIFVQPQTGFLGYAPFGGIGNGDGVVIDASAFGLGSGCGSINPEAPFNLGRTATHEVGHYLFLEHIWGNGCNTDDEVSDTPAQAREYDGCPFLGASSCGSTDMHMNYMDYTNDACMYMFSEGQSQRMEVYINANLSSLVQNTSNVYEGSLPENPGGGTDGGNGGEEPPVVVCDYPSTSDIDQLTQTGVIINWEDQSDATRYRIRYKAAGGRWLRKTSNQSKVQLTQLSPNTNYEYQLRSRCPEGWTSWSSKESFSTPKDDQGGSGPNGYRLVVTLDDYGSETTWFIVDDQYNDVGQGGPYQDFNSGRKIETPIELPDGCYSLEIYDAWGDGMCCEYGAGSVKIYGQNDEVLASSDGRFGSYDIIDFCLVDGRAKIANRKKDSKKKNTAKKGK